MVGLGVREPGLFGGRHRWSLPIESVAALGSHAVMIEADAANAIGTVEGVVVDADQRSGKDARGPATDLERRVTEHGLTVVGKRVLTEAGTEVGLVHDVIVDESGSIERFDLGPEAENELSGSDMIGLGDHALIVSEAGS